MYKSVVSSHTVLLKSKLSKTEERVKNKLNEKCIALSGTGSILEAVVKKERGNSVSNVGLCCSIKASSFPASRTQASTCSLVGLSVMAMTRTMMSDSKLK